MAIDKKLIHFKLWNTFMSSDGVNGNYTKPSSGTAGSGSALYGQVKETSIVFIQDVQKIWTHGQLYDCSSPDLSKYLTDEDLETIRTSISDLNTAVGKKQESITDLTTIRSGAALGATAVQPGTLSSYVKTSRTINNKALSSDITLTASDVGAAPSSLSTTVANLTTSNVAEGTNKYFTDSRARAAITGAASTIAGSDLDKSLVLVSNDSGKVAVSSVTSTELEYLSGTSSNIQTQINNKAAKSVETTVSTHVGSTSNPHSVTKSQVGLGNVENTKLSTWSGSNNITTVGTITSGTWNGTAISNNKLANSSITLAGQSVSLGGTLSAGDLRTGLGINNVDNTADANKSVLYAQSSGSAASADSVEWTNVNNKPSFATVATSGSYYDLTDYPTSLPASGGTADNATTLKTTRNIDGVDFNGSADITHYGECSTSASTAAKTVSITGFKKVKGARVIIKFTTTNTANNPTLNITSTGAASIMYRGSNISKGYLAANRVYEFVYDGSDYELVGDIDTNTTGFAITANGGGDNVVILTPTSGTNAVTYNASHAQVGPASGYTSGNSTTSISGYGASKTIKIPQLTVDSYGHVTVASDENVTITMPNQITAADLGLAAALKYCGITTTALTDGSETNPIKIDGVNHQATAGCTVFYEDKEFVFNGSKWEELGYARSLTLNEVTTGNPSGTSTVATGGHTHSCGADSTNTVSVSKSNHTHSVSKTSSTGTGVATSTHTHQLTASGSVTSSFTGEAVTSGSASSNTTSVATGAHTHSVTGTVGNGGVSHNHSVSLTAASNGAAHTHTYVDTTYTLSGSASGGVLTISLSSAENSLTSGSTTASHTHSVTGNTGSTTATHSHTFSSGTATAATNNTTNRVSVPNTSHTHSVTASGSVSSSFTGSAATTSSISGTTTVASQSHTHTASADSTNVSTVSTSSHIHTASATASTVNVASGSHTHNVTPTGSIS